MTELFVLTLVLILVQGKEKKTFSQNYSIHVYIFGTVDRFGAGKEEGGRACERTAYSTRLVYRNPVF